ALTPCFSMKATISPIRSSVTEFLVTTINSLTLLFLAPSFFASTRVRFDAYTLLSDKVTIRDSRIPVKPDLAGNGPEIRISRMPAIKYDGHAIRRNAAVRPKSPCSGRAPGAARVPANPMSVCRPRERVDSSIQGFFPEGGEQFVHVDRPADFPGGRIAGIVPLQVIDHFLG